MIENFFLLNKRQLDFPLVMGILNVTPDSFSDGGKYFDHRAAIQHAEYMIEKGVDIIDVGGESTRPGALNVTTEEELERVIPVIKKILSEHPEALISIDTIKSSVAKEAIMCGARIINDISGGQFDENIFKVAAENSVPIVINHIQGTPETMQNSPSYKSVAGEILYYFEERISVAKNYGVEKIILDPGIGFGKTVENNYEIIADLKSFKSFGYPLMIGLSRKSFLGKSLSLEIDERDVASIITETIAIERGVDIIRTHNIENALQMKKIFLNMKRQQVV